MTSTGGQDLNRHRRGRFLHNLWKTEKREIDGQGEKETKAERERERGRVQEERGRQKR